MKLIELLVLHQVSATANAEDLVGRSCLKGLLLRPDLPVKGACNVKSGHRYPPGTTTGKQTWADMRGDGEVHAEGLPARFDGTSEPEIITIAIS